MSDSQAYTLRWRGRQTGPYPISEINRLLDDHKIGMGHEIFYENEWITLEQFFPATQRAAAAEAMPHAKGPFPSIPLAPAPAVREKASPVRVTVSVTQNAMPATGGGRPRHRLVFALLAVFTGFSGAHNFYARQWLTGLLQLLLSVATWLMHFGIVASWLWAIMEAILVRKDGNGNDMV